MHQPWFKFYPGDWRSDPSLRMCSLAARGLWMDMLCLMHEADPRGHLVINGRPVTAPQLASLCGVSPKEAAPLLAELADAGVFSLGDDGGIFSRRMTRDTEKAAKDKANGKGGGNPSLKPPVKRGVNPPSREVDNREDKAQKLEAREEPSQQRNLTEKKVEIVSTPARPAGEVDGDGTPSAGAGFDAGLPPGKVVSQAAGRGLLNGVAATTLAARLEKPASDSPGPFAGPSKFDRGAA